MPTDTPTFRPLGWSPPAVARREYDQKRGSSTQRGYDHRWQQTRARFLSAHPACCQCGAQATEADHIIAKRRGGSDEWGNLQPLCKPCHSRKTVLHDGGLKRGD